MNIRRLITYSIFLVCICLASIAYLVTDALAAKMFAIVEMEGGAPVIDQQATPYKGYLHCGSIGKWGMYIIAGTGPQLLDINALPKVTGICAVTEGGEGQTKWPELDETVAPAVRTKLNTWLTVRGYPTIPAGWSNRQVILAIYKRANAKVELETEDVAE